MKIICFLQNHYNDHLTITCTKQDQSALHQFLILLQLLNSLLHYCIYVLYIYSSIQLSQGVCVLCNVLREFSVLQPKTCVVSYGNLVSYSLKHE